MTDTADREMLELAALAVGIEGVYEESYGLITIYHGGNDLESWNPLIDDGDCARMEAALLLEVEFAGGYAKAWSRHLPDEWPLARVPFGDDRQAARRLASTRVAAEIGRRMKEAARG